MLREAIAQLTAALLSTVKIPVVLAAKKGLKRLKKYKWFVGPSLPIAFVFEVVKIGKKKGNRRREINNLFISYFCSNNYMELESLVNGWKSNPLFKPRMKILRDCVHGLRRANAGCNPSNYVLPTLIAQIDGIQQKYMEKRGLTLASKGKWKDASGKEVDWKSWYKSQTTNQGMLAVANDIFLNFLHKILHGDEPEGANLLSGRGGMDEKK